MALLQTQAEAAEPLSPEQVVAALAQVSFPRTHRLADFWLKHDAEQHPLTQLYCQIQGQKIAALPEGYGVRSKVHEYGGLPYGLGETKIVWVDEQSQQLYCAALAAPPEVTDLEQLSSPILLDSLKVLTQNPDCRYGEPVLHPSQRWVVAIEERHSGTKQPVINQLVAFDLTSGQRWVLASGADFYTSPCFNAAGTALAWIEWVHPHQPWNETRLCQAQWQADQLLDKTIVFPRAQEKAAVQQPCFNAQGELLFISDHEGYWNLYLQPKTGPCQRLYAVDADCASAPWQFGNRHYALIEPDNDGSDAQQLQLLVCVTRGGQWQLEQLSLHCDRQGQWRLAAPVVRINTTPRLSFFSQISLSFNQDCLLALVASEQYALSIVHIHLDASVERLGQSVFLDQGAHLQQAVRPESVQLNFKAHQVQGLFYACPNRAQAPLMINVHGGPTSAAFCGLQANIQYWCQQGFSVLDLNHRGSTGFGRAYRQALKGQWGEVDLEDARLMAHWLGKQGRIQANQVVIRGQSAGGYSALRAATLGYFQAAVSLYGISDLQRLAASTHKFESYYLHWLIGDPKEDAMLYQLRSPLYSLNQQADLPALLLFQGEQDRVVPVDQVTQFAQHYQTLGYNCATVVYANEGHGFRAYENRLHQLKTEHHFYLAQGILDHGFA